jgi:hypothetical protein
MARRFHPKSTPKENLYIFIRSIPWKLLIIFPILVVFAVPAYIYGAHTGGKAIPSVSSIFYNLSNQSDQITPTPLPAFPSRLPQVGTIPYTISAGDNCDEVLAFQMNMDSASQIFSDANPVTVQALERSIGLNCHTLQPGMHMSLSPQYPLVALGGVVENITSTNPRQAAPTPLVPIPNQTNPGPDCSGGCLLTVRVAPGVNVTLNVQTTLTLHNGAWVWAQAMMARQSINGFGNYPYTAADATLNGMQLPVCDFQVNDTHDDNSTTCSSLTPNTIQIDGGAWMYAVTGQNGLNHWNVNLKVPAETQVLIWLTNNAGQLTYQAGNPAYRYDAASHHYVKIS